MLCIPKFTRSNNLNIFLCYVIKKKNCVGIITGIRYFDDSGQELCPTMVPLPWRCSEAPPWHVALVFILCHYLIFKSSIVRARSSRREDSTRSESLLIECFAHATRHLVQQSRRVLSQKEMFIPRAQWGTSESSFLEPTFFLTFL